MEKIWANQLIAGTKTFSQVPEFRKAAVLAELEARLNAEKITQQKYNEILGIEDENENEESTETETPAEGTEE